MAREPQTIEVHALGAVTFRPLGKVAMERLQEAARRSGHQGGSTQEAEDVLLVSKQLVEPRFPSHEALLAALEGHDHVIREIAAAIQAASWPNQPSG
jgi:hypothetical protein